MSMIEPEQPWAQAQRLTSKGDLDTLESWARRENIAIPHPEPHEYDGSCPWCRADKAPWIGGGAHEHALKLIERVRIAERDLERLRELEGWIDHNLFAVAIGKLGEWAKERKQHKSPPS